MAINEALAEYLALYHKGEVNAVTSRELECSFQMRGSELRREINALRGDGIPICSFEGGYYYAATAEELERTIRQLRSRINTESTDVRNYTMWTSGYIGCKAGEVIRVRCPDGTFESGGGSIWPIAVQYNAMKESTGAVTYKATSGTSYDAVFDSDGKGFSITINDLSVAFIRIVGNGDAAGAIITKNQEITYKQVWVGTPMQFGDEVKQNMANVFVQAPNGTLYTIAVDNSGNLSAKAFTQ